MKIKKGTEINEITQDEVVKYELDCGLKLFICKKKNFKKYVAMFGTEYGSIDNEFIDIHTGNKIKAPEGIAHFLEHKLFEQPDGNALDMFAKMGVSANAYTSFDKTVYYFETTERFKQSIEKLVELVTKPYFTDENVEKEKGIIQQELKMYQDNPASVVYYNTLKAMYVKHPLNIDIGGTEESIKKITIQDLYTCYNNFYDFNNMFFIISGDVDTDKTADFLNNIFNKIKTNNKVQTKRIKLLEPKEINKSKIETTLDVFMPYISIGFKLMPTNGSNNKKRKLMTELIQKVCFSKTANLYERMYSKGIINDIIDMEYEYGKDFAYIIILGCSLEVAKYKKEIISEIEKLKKEGVSEADFNIAKNQIIGKQIYYSEKPSIINNQIIDSIIQDTDVFEELKILRQIQVKDINSFVCEAFDYNNLVESIVMPKGYRQDN